MTPPTELRIGCVLWRVSRLLTLSEIHLDFPYLADSLASMGVSARADLIAPGRRCQSRSAYLSAEGWRLAENVPLPCVRRFQPSPVEHMLARLRRHLTNADDPGPLLRALGRLIEGPHGSTRPCPPRERKLPEGVSIGPWNR